MPELTYDKIEKEIIDWIIKDEEKGDYKFLKIIDNNAEYEKGNTVMEVTNNTTQDVTIRLLSIIKNECKRKCKFRLNLPEDNCTYKYDPFGSYTKLLCPNESVSCKAWIKPSLEQIPLNDALNDDTKPILVPNRYTILFSNNPNVITTFKAK